MKWLRNLFAAPRQKAADCFEQGRVALDQNDFDLAISWFNACIEQTPGQSLGFFGRGFAHLKKGDYDRAIADLSEAIRLRPDNAYSYYYRSLCYSGKGRATLEAADFERALKLGAQVGEPALEGAPGAVNSGEEIVMALRAALCEAARHDMDETVRALAGKAFTQLDSQSPARVPALLEALRHEEPDIRFGAAQTLGDMGADARPALATLVQALQDRHLGVRLQAARAVWLIDRQVPPVIPVLIEALQGEDEVLRWIAADCLGEIGPAAGAAGPALQAALHRSFEIAHARTGVALALERVTRSVPS